jgi:hypothetical protein
MTQSQASAGPDRAVSASAKASPGSFASASFDGLDGRGTRWVWAYRLGLTILPLVLALGFYYRPYVFEGQGLPTGGDRDFYIYQTARMAQLDGRWWELGSDDLLCQPYPSGMAQYPQLYEGVDLLLISSLSARILDPVVNFHALNVMVLVMNGWVAAWLVVRATRSYGWAALAVVLITLNMCVDLRVAGHLHGFKYCWMLLAIASFLRYLDTPSLGRGLLLGILTALVLVSSFYWGFFLALCFGAWWLVCLVAGSVGRQHIVPAVAAGVIFALLGTALTFPVWKDASGFGPYVNRDQGDVWKYSSEPWQYFVSRYWPRADYFLRADRKGGTNEGWNYPGVVVLSGLAAYGVAKLRGWRLAEERRRYIDGLLGLSAVLVIISLWGGPSLVIFKLVPSFRCYGRAGMMAVGLWCVATPVLLCYLVQRLRWPAVGAGVLVAALALALYERERDFGHGGLNTAFRPEPDAAWVNWLAQQPTDVRVVVLPLDQYQDARDMFYIAYLSAITIQKHPILNGCDFTVLRADLKEYGSTPRVLNLDGLRYVVSLGYNTLVFRRDYRQANPWVGDLDGLELHQVLDDWYIYRVKNLPKRPVSGPGTHIDCTKTSSLVYLSRGWHGCEEELQWSDREAVVKFRLDKVQPLKLRMMAKTLGPQRIIVSLNGKATATHQSSGQELELIEVCLPADALAECNTLTFVFPDARQRPTSGKGIDNRTFGWGVKWMEFALVSPKE